MGLAVNDADGWIKYTKKKIIIPGPDGWNTAKKFKLFIYVVLPSIHDSKLGRHLFSCNSLNMAVYGDDHSSETRVSKIKVTRYALTL